MMLSLLLSLLLLKYWNAVEMHTYFGEIFQRKLSERLKTDGNNTPPRCSSH